MSDLDIKQQKNYNGVKGWLALLCYILIIGIPLKGIYNLVISYLTILLVSDKYPNLIAFFYIDVILSILLIILGIRAGLALWDIKTNAVRITKLYFLILIGYAIVSLIPLSILDLQKNITDTMSEQILTHFIQMLLFSITWYLYLVNSKRVKATYLNINQDINKEKTILNSSITINESNKLNEFYTTQIKSKIKILKLNELNSVEIIIISVIIGLVIALILGFAFGETYYYSRGIRVTEPTHLKEFHFNYLLGVSGFIITSGISYIYLNRKIKK